MNETCSGLCFDLKDAVYVPVLLKIERMPASNQHGCFSLLKTFPTFGNNKLTHNGNSNRVPPKIN